MLTHTSPSKSFPLALILIVFIVFIVRENGVLERIFLCCFAGVITFKLYSMYTLPVVGIHPNTIQPIDMLDEVGIPRSSPLGLYLTYDTPLSSALTKLKSLLDTNDHETFQAILNAIDAFVTLYYSTMARKSEDDMSQNLASLIDMRIDIMKKAHQCFVKYTMPELVSKMEMILLVLQGSTHKCISIAKKKFFKCTHVTLAAPYASNTFQNESEVF